MYHSPTSSPSIYTPKFISEALTLYSPYLTQCLVVYHEKCYICVALTVYQSSTMEVIVFFFCCAPSVPVTQSDR